MSKKVISVLLSVAIVATMLCIGVGMVTASADTVTYYFLAPDSYLSTNGTVGIYYWQPQEPAKWPGVEMKKEESIGKNVFSAQVGDNDETETIIFNAFVDAGDPADPALAAVAHQTEDISVIGDADHTNYYGMIYVLANDDDHKKVNESTGAVKGSGKWFSLDPESPEYYKNSKEFYGSYGFPEENPDDANKEVHKDDTVKVSLTLGGVAKAGTLTSYIKFDSGLLKYTGNKSTTADGQLLVNDTFAEEDNLKDTIIVGAVFDAEGTDAYAGDPAEVYTFEFTALQDTNLADVKAAVSQFAEEITKIENQEVVDVYTNYNHIEEGNAFSDLAFAVECPHTDDTSSTSSTSTSSTSTSSTGTSSTGGTSSTSTSSTSTSSTGTSSTGTSSTDGTSSTGTSSTGSVSQGSSSTGVTSKDSSSKGDSSTGSSKASSASSSKPTSSTPANGSAIQTAGTFAIISLVVVLMAAAAVVLYSRKKTEE